MSINDIADRDALGVATSSDAILAVDADASAGDRLRRIVFDGSDYSFLSGKGALASPIGRVVTNTVTDGPNCAFGHSTNVIADDISTSSILGGGCTGYNNVIGGDGSVTVKTLTPNTASAVTGAHVSVVAGYDNVAGQLSSKIISDHSYTAIGGNGHNAIFGGANHVIAATAEYSMIGGGNTNSISGAGCFVSGLRNTVGGTGSISFGYDNTITHNGGYATGAAHNVTAIFAQAHGSTNNAEGNFSRAEGNFSRARAVGQQAFSGGRFTAQGDAQTSVIEMHRLTTDATITTLGVLNSTTSFQLLPNQSVVFDSLIIARDAAGTDSAAWRVAGMARRAATGTPVLVGVAVTAIAADAGAATWAVAVSADSAGGLNTRITGEAAKSIRWVQRMTLVEVLAP